MSVLRWSADRDEDKKKKKGDYADSLVSQERSRTTYLAISVYLPIYVLLLLHTYATPLYTRNNIQ